jgi:hypothetical protein
VILVRAVREVQARTVDQPDELAQHLGRRGRRTDRRDDLRAARDDGHAYRLVARTISAPPRLPSDSRSTSHGWVALSSTQLGRVASTTAS